VRNEAWASAHGTRARSSILRRVPEQTRELWVSSDPRRPRTDEGEIVAVPEDWELLPPGDAALTRRVKQAGPAWVVKQKRGRRTFSQGVWAPTQTIARLRAELEAERADPRHAARLEAGRKRRGVEQARYVEQFEAAVRAFLAFAPAHAALEEVLAEAIVRHATPVGSGTVARTKRIPIERRAEAATIAWLRHETTGYDDMKIPRVAGMRREVRRRLAERSRRLLALYRRGDDVGPDCPLRIALERI
jgi:hypothetical protein